MKTLTECIVKTSKTKKIVFMTVISRNLEGHLDSNSKSVKIIVDRLLRVTDKLIIVKLRKAQQKKLADIIIRLSRGRIFY